MTTTVHQLRCVPLALTLTISVEEHAVDVAQGVADAPRVLAHEDERYPARIDVILPHLWSEAFELVTSGAQDEPRHELRVLLLLAWARLPWDGG
ncbi:hypothetical protein [Nocardiopsis dassonvillei]|uniref:hypothetical protein n=1 Tax=Nocardiopsis dassonvillei TaxID=2014 RepID=UPI00366C26B9